MSDINALIERQQSIISEISGCKNNLKASTSSEMTFAESENRRESFVDQILNSENLWNRNKDLARADDIGNLAKADDFGNLARPDEFKNDSLKVETRTNEMLKESLRSASLRNEALRLHLARKDIKHTFRDASFRKEVYANEDRRKNELGKEVSLFEAFGNELNRALKEEGLANEDLTNKFKYEQNLTDSGEARGNSKDLNNGFSSSGSTGNAHTRIDFFRKDTSKQYSIIEGLEKDTSRNEKSRSDALGSKDIRSKDIRSGALKSDALKSKTTKSDSTRNVEPISETNQREVSGCESTKNYVSSCQSTKLYVTRCESTKHYVSRCEPTDHDVSICEDFFNIKAGNDEIIVPPPNEFSNDQKTENKDVFNTDALQNENEIEKALNQLNNSETQASEEIANNKILLTREFLNNQPSYDNNGKTDLPSEIQSKIPSGMVWRQYDTKNQQNVESEKEVGLSTFQQFVLFLFRYNCI